MTTAACAWRIGVRWGSLRGVEMKLVRIGLIAAVLGALLAMGAVPAWASTTTINDGSASISGATGVSCDSVNDNHADTPSAATFSGPFTYTHSVAPANASAS